MKKMALQNKCLSNNAKFNMAYGSVSMLQSPGMSRQILKQETA